MIIGDLSLAQAIERISAEDDAAYVRAMMKLHPDAPFANLEFENGVACFAGRSPFSATHGFGTIPGRHDADLLARIERFYSEKGYPSVVALPSVVEPAFTKLLFDRGYGTVTFRNVYVHRAQVEASADPAISVKEAISAEDRALWLKTVSDAFAGRELEKPDDISAGQAIKEGNRFFLGYCEGRPAAASALYVNGKVARLAGMGTIAAYRARGLQASMIVERVRLALRLGASCIFSDSQPGNNSQRNLERYGFKLAYVRAILRKAL